MERKWDAMAIDQLLPKYARQLGSDRGITINHLKRFPSIHWSLGLFANPEFPIPDLLHLARFNMRENRIQCVCENPNFTAAHFDQLMNDHDYWKIARKYNPEQRNRIFSWISGYKFVNDEVVKKYPHEKWDANLLMCSSISFDFVKKSKRFKNSKSSFTLNKNMTLDIARKYPDYTNMQFLTKDTPREVQLANPDIKWWQSYKNYPIAITPEIFQNMTEEEIGCGIDPTCLFDEPFVTWEALKKSQVDSYLWCEYGRSKNLTWDIVRSEPPRTFYDIRHNKYLNWVEFWGKTHHDALDKQLSSGNNYFRVDDFYGHEIGVSRSYFKLRRFRVRFIRAFQRAFCGKLLATLGFPPELSDNVLEFLRHPN